MGVLPVSIYDRMEQPASQWAGILLVGKRCSAGLCGHTIICTNQLRVSPKRSELWRPQAVAGRAHETGLYTCP